MAIGTVLVVSKLKKRATTTYATSFTQTEPGLWLPQVPMWIDTPSESSLSSLDTGNLEMEVIPHYKQTTKLVNPQL